MGVITISSFYKKPSPEKIKETVVFNKKTYSSQLKELRFLIKTKQADNFTTNMYLALIEGRKITPKMLDAINKIIKRNSPAEVEKKRIEVARLLGKKKLVSELLSKCDYHHIYVARSEYFLDSIEEQIRRWGNLTKNQKIALNKMYKRFLKKSEKKA
tara:strand:- start:187 stop:657 length:471 start_codon:yes stop_codon:yes gene_type:complete